MTGLICDQSEIIQVESSKAHLETHSWGLRENVGQTFSLIFVLTEHIFETVKSPFLSRDFQVKVGGVRPPEAGQFAVMGV